MIFAGKQQSGVSTFDAKGGNQGGNSSHKVSTCDNRHNEKKLQDLSVWIGANEGGNLLGISVQAMRKRCKKAFKPEKYVKKQDGLTVRQVRKNGGLQYEILLSSLPDFAQVEYWKAHHEQKQMTGIEIARRDEEFRRRGEIADWNKEVALLRHRVLKAYLRFVAEAPPKMTMVYKKRFCELFNEGVFEELQDTRRKVKRVSYQTLDIQRAKQQRITRMQR